MGLAKQDSLQQPQILHKYIRTLKTDVTNASFFISAARRKNAKFSKVPSASKRKECPKMAARPSSLWIHLFQ